MKAGEAVINALSLISPFLLDQLAIAEVMNCNGATSQFSLSLSTAEAVDLLEIRAESLKNFGRIEFAGGIIKKLILKFSKSPFISQYNYAEILNNMLELFYYYKDEMLDQLSDDELLNLMKEYFDCSCQGSVSLLQNRVLDAMARNVRYGRKAAADFALNHGDYDEVNSCQEEDCDE